MIRHDHKFNAFRVKFKDGSEHAALICDRGVLNGLDLFSGIGGLTMALHPWVRPVAYCENDRYAQSVLLCRMRSGDIPAAPIWDDVLLLEGSFLPGVDIIYGGFPCQDISVAGTGRGLEGERSGLFFEVGRLVREINPSFVFLENVPAIRTRGAERVGKELANYGYDSRWDIISAAEVGAPHKRERWFLLAYRRSEGLQESRDNEIATSKMDKTISRRDTRFSDAAAASLQSRRIPSQFCLQKNFWEKTYGELLRMDDGIPPQTHRIRALGNAVVPLQAREAFMRLMGIKQSEEGK